MPKCKKCGLDAKAVSVEGLCMQCFFEEVRKRSPGLKIKVVGDYSDLAKPPEGV